MSELMASPLKMLGLNSSRARECSLYFLPTPLALTPDFAHSGIGWYDPKSVDNVETIPLWSVLTAKTICWEQKPAQRCDTDFWEQLLVLFRHLVASGFSRPLVCSELQRFHIVNRMDELFYSCHYSKKGFIECLER